MTQTEKRNYCQQLCNSNVGILMRPTQEWGVNFSLLNSILQYFIKADLNWAKIEKTNRKVQVNLQLSNYQFNFKKISLCFFYKIHTTFFNFIFILLMCTYKEK